MEHILRDLFSDKYSLRQKLEALAWGEKNTEIYYELIRTLYPKYYMGGQDPIRIITILRDLGIMDENFNVNREAIK